jgi:hypothetical protein
MKWARLYFCLAAVTSCGGQVDRNDQAPDADVPQVDAKALNDRCDRALPVTLAGGGAVIVGDTSVGTDEFSELTCDSPNVAFTFNQAQLYYRLELPAEQRYRLRLKPTFYGFVYAFAERIGCSFNAIEAACSSHGIDGEVSPIANPNTETALELVPSQAEAYVVGVDGDTSAGPFVLNVERVDD